MSVSIVNNANIFLSMRTTATQGKPAEKLGEQSFSFFLQRERTKNIAGAANNQINAPKLEMSAERYIEWEREARVSDIPCLPLAGRWDDSTKESRGILQQIAGRYFDEAKEKYGCTKDYRPYLSGLPEFDSKIEEAIRLEVRDRLNADPRVPRLVAQIEGIYPIPDKFDPDKTFGHNRMQRLP